MKTSLMVFCCLLAGVHPESVIEVTGYVGRSAVIRCPYDKGYEGRSKYLCRGSCPLFGGNNIPVRTEEGQTEAIKGRFSLRDDITARVFTVTITGLTEEDAGQYWCAVTKTFINDYSEVKLKVEKGPSTTLLPSTEVTTLSPSPSTSPTPSSSQPGPTLETTIRGQSTAVVVEDTEDSAVILILCAVALLVLVTVCGLASILCYKQRRKQSAGNAPASQLHMSSPTEEPNDYEEAEELGRTPGPRANDYEEAEELGSSPGPRASVSSLYCMAGAAQRPSVVSLYTTVKQVPTQTMYCHSQDHMDPIYSNDTQPEQTTSPTMHYSNVVSTQHFLDNGASF